MKMSVSLFADKNPTQFNEPVVSNSMRRKIKIYVVDKSPKLFEVLLIYVYFFVRGIYSYFSLESFISRRNVTGNFSLSFTNESNTGASC